MESYIKMEQLPQTFLTHSMLISQCMLWDIIMTTLSQTLLSLFSHFKILRVLTLAQLL